MPTPAFQSVRSRIGRVCVAIIGDAPAELLEKAAATVKDMPFLELRLDYLPKPALAMPGIKQFIAENTAATVIATCRRSEGGGKFAGSVASELDILIQAAEAGCHIVDLELESAEKLKPADLKRLREAGSAIILSHHDFAATRNLDGVYARILPFAPDFVKIVSTAKTLHDNVTLMRFLERADQPNIVGICMGDFGVISRVLGVRAGSAFTFASASEGEETGPGQIAARTLLETYRIDDVDASTKVYGVAGDPVGQSLSPLMLNTAFRRETVNAVYLALQTKKMDDLVACVHEIPIQGLSITMPHKQAIMPYLEHTDPLSAKIGACNTVLRAPDGKLYGFNTDVAGIVTPLERRIPLRGAKILVLGAGGAARAAVFGLREKGAEVFILNRTLETAQKLAKQAGAKVVKREALAKSNFDVVLNATPIGMAGYKGAADLKGAPPITAAELNAIKPRLVFDLVYHPIDTPLIRLARQQGIPVVTGVEMFVYQGARQFEIWTGGKPAPTEEMLRVVVHALRNAAETAAAEPKTAHKAEPKPAPAAVPIKSAAKPTAVPAKAATKSKAPAKAARTKKAS